MSDLRVPNMLDDVARMRKDVDDLLRRARPIAAEDTGGEGCCGRYCCLDDDGHTASTGQIVNTCVFEPDPVGGTGVRLSVHGWVRVRAGGAGAFSIVGWTDIDAVAYDGAPKVELAAVANLDTYTFPLGGTYDVDVPDPVITLRFQNLSTVSWSIVQVYAELTVLPREGDSACGHAHAGTGPL